MSDEGTGGWGATDWRNFQSLLATANVLSPTDSSGGDRPVWFSRPDVAPVGLPTGAGPTGGGSEGSASGTPPSPGRVRNDASDRSRSGEPSSLAGDALRRAGLSGAGASGGSATDSAVTIANGATVEIHGLSAQSVTFIGTTGTLKLEDPEAFTGVISGLTGSDAIDFANLTYSVNVKATYSGDATGGTLTVTDGAKTARVALSGDYLSSTWTLSDDGKGGVRVVDPTLPAGVTLQQIDGGPNYYANNGFTYAANAGWDNPDFFAIGPWLDSLLVQSDATRWLDLGWNTAFGITGNTVLSIARANGISVIQNADESILSGTGAETVGLLSADENYAASVASVNHTANSIQDGRYWWLQNTWTVLAYGSIGNTPMSQILTQQLITPNGTTRNFNIDSADVYWFTGSKDGGILGQDSGIYGLSQLTEAQGARGSNYGDMVDILRSYQTTNPAPIAVFIEDGEPGNNGTDADYITPPELNWAAWSSIIHGARQIIYFNHSFTGSNEFDDNVSQAFYQTVQPGQKISIYGQIKSTDAEIEQLAPVINSPFADGYVTVNGSTSYVFPTPDLSLAGGLEVMAKDYNGQFYIFADTRDAETTTNIPATFTIADKNATSVTVVNENRTIAVVNGVFTDTFATAATVHIYEVNDGSGGTGSTSPAIIGISDSPASGDLGAGKTVTLTLAFSSAVTVAGKPTLTLNDGGTATYASGSGTSALTFTYIVAAGQNTAGLAATAVNLPSGATIASSAGAASLSLAGLTQSGPQIDTIAPAAPTISGDSVSGNVVTLKGAAEANSTITVFDNATQLGTASTNASGAWTFTTAALASGDQSFTAKATDGAGNVSPLSAALAVTLAAGSSGGGTGGGGTNLVTNGSFETGSLSGWTLGGNSAVVSAGPQLFVDTTAESGAYAAAFGSVGSDGTLSQTIATTAGQSYTLSFWLENEAAGANDFKAIWNGQTLLSLTSAAQSGYTQYTYTVTATAAASTLQFSARNDPKQWDLDNISLTALAGESAGSGTNLVTNGSFETDSLSGWTLGGNSAVVSAGPQLFVDTTAESGAYAAAFGSVGSDGTLSQTIATTAGQTYTLSFWLENEAAGANDFKATWNGQTLLSLTSAAQSGYTQYTYTVTATAAASTLQFSARNDPKQWDLDNISLTANGSSAQVDIIAPTAMSFASGVTIKDSAGNAANLSLAGRTQSGPQIDTAAPTVMSLVASPAKGALSAGKTVTLTLNFSEPVTVAGGRPTLTLNDGGTATYVGGSGSKTLTFNYTVAAGQNIASLAAAWVTLPSGVTIKDGAGTNPNLSLAGLTQSGPQIDTTAPTVTSVVASPGTGTQFPGDPITITVKLSEAVTVTGGAPLLLLNDGGTATYASGSGTNTLTFKYTVGANDKDVSTLAILAVKLPTGVTIKDGPGNAANMAGAVHSFAGLAVDPPVVSTKPDGSYEVAYSNLTGLSYSSYEDIFNSAGTQIAEARDMIGGAGTLILNADHLTVSSSSGSLGVATGSDTFKVNSHASEAIIATGRAAETFDLGLGFGHEFDHRLADERSFSRPHRIALNDGQGPKFNKHRGPELERAIVQRRRGSVRRQRHHH